MRENVERCLNMTLDRVGLMPAVTPDDFAMEQHDCGCKKNGKLCFGIIGSGNRGINCFGKMIVFHEDLELTALADPCAQRMVRAVDVIGTAPVCYTDVDDMMLKENLDAVVITSPDYTHEENVLKVIRHGVKVLVDKPLATSTAGCRRIIAEAEKYGVNVSVGFNLRHVPLLRRIKEIIDSGAIGKLMLIENQEFYGGGRTYMSRWNRKRQYSGGLWIHKGSHDFDLFNWWNKDGRPVRVSAFAGLSAFKMERIPFELKAGETVGPYCTDCICRDRCPDAFERNLLYGPDTANSDGYLPDLCIYASDKDTHDNGIAIIEYDNDVRCSHTECFVAGFSDRIYTVVGDRGVITACLSNPARIEIRPRWGGAVEVTDIPVSEGDHVGADP
ncbi:MAG: Gfo/Idh/MocA family oxidoreductase, partial [bacterium]|nr:Gfo/Idh/MocA family oxidoreductase [bacterium]